MWKSKLARNLKLCEGNNFGTKGISLVTVQNIAFSRKPPKVRLKVLAVVFITMNTFSIHWEGVKLDRFLCNIYIFALTPDGTGNNGRTGKWDVHLTYATG